MSDLTITPVPAVAADEWYRLGCVLHAEGRWGAAAACFARAGDEDHKALVNLGWNRHLQGMSAAAVEPLKRAKAMGPADGVAAALLGQVYLALGADIAALGYAREGVADAPESPIAHVALAFALMFNGEWEAGWREYEWRYRYRPEMYPPRPQPLWRGERVERLWVEAEQGFGDTIFGLRWLAEVEARVGEIVFFVQPEIYSWVRGWAAERRHERRPKSFQILPLPRAVPQADAWCPLLSLPAAMGVGKPTYDYRPEIGPGSKAFFTKPCRIGFCWKGNPAHEQAHHRDVPLPYWLPLFENGGVEWHSLQVGGTAELAPLGALPLVEDRGPEITNFSDTAKIVEGLDLIITVDTALAHLAGVMGKPVWLILNQRGQDFRWGRGERAPWYPNVRIIRRGLGEDWVEVMARVAGELR